MTMDRRKFLELMGCSVALASLSGCSSLSRIEPQSQLPWIDPTDVDDLVVGPGIRKKILIKWGDKIAVDTKGEDVFFGTNNDFTAFIPFNKSNPLDGIMMVNHESCHSLFVSGYDDKKNISKSIEQVHQEQKSVGISLLRLTKRDDEWGVQFNDAYNRRISALDPIPLVSSRPIDGSLEAMGTLANCAGGITPWNTFLTCEENYDIFYGEYFYKVSHRKKKKVIRQRTFPSKELNWSLYEDRSPEHYGWVVEVQPLTGKAQKLTALGRFSHEGATCTRSKDGKVVVYMGDDSNNECLYKFISDRSDSLQSGTLYVASLEKRQWIPLDIRKNADLKRKFKDQTELLIRTREAARVVGASKLDRPEDIEINPRNGDVIVALTNNLSNKNPYGSLLKIKEDQGDHGSLSFQHETFLTGGLETGLSCPDNMAFDARGNLWVTNDISDDKMNHGEYKKFKNNGLYFVPMSGPQAGKVYQVASAPRDAEITGPMWLPDQQTLVVSVQHPGAETKSLDKLTSSWPEGNGQIPKSAVVALSGPGLTRLMNM